MELYFFYILAAVVILAISIILSPERRYKNGNYFLPPLEIHPAEAGNFIDDTVNFEEIIGTIFYWGYKGYITIEETDNPINDIDKMYDTFIHSQDYVILKKSELPEDAGKYEKKLFEIVFPNGKNHCEVRELKGNVAQEIENTIKELKKSIDEKGYYLWKTRKNGEVIKNKGLGMLTIFNKIKPFNALKLFLLIVLSGFLLPYLLISWGLFALGKVIPIKNKKFRDYYSVAKYFERFIRKSKTKEIEAFMLQDKDYFNKTFPYAAAMGYGWQWTEKCLDYIENTPEWYKGYGEYTKADFLNFTNQSYFIMKKAFTSNVSDLENFTANKRYRR